MLLAFPFGLSLVFAGLGLLLGEQGGLGPPILLNGLSEPSGGVLDLLLALEPAGEVAGGPFYKFRLVSLDDGAGGFLGYAMGGETGDETGKAGDRRAAGREYRRGGSW